MKSLKLAKSEVETTITAEEANRRIGRWFQGKEAMKDFNPEDNIEDALFFKDFRDACRQSLDGIYKKYPEIKARVLAAKAARE